MIKVQNFLDERLILLGIQAADRDDAYNQIACAIGACGCLESGKESELCIRLSEREEMGTTAMGHGVAIPHVYSPDITEPMVVFARLDKPIDFNTPDGQKVDKIFLLVGPKRNELDHLMLMARISRLLRDQAFFERLSKAASAAEIIAAVKEVENRH